MANPNDNLYRLYQNGLKHFSLPDFDTFQKDMKDEQKRRRFYTNMQEAYSLPDFDKFSQDIGAVAPPAPVQQQTAQPQQQSPTPVKPITDNTAQQASAQQPVQTSSQPAQPQGWTASPMQQQAFQRQMDEANARMKKQGEEFQQRMEGIKKGNKSGAFMGEREFNPSTGQMETAYYTTQGERVPTQMQQSKANTEHHQWWENNTEAGQRSKEQRLQHEFDNSLSGLWSRHNPSEGENAAEQAWSAAEKRQREASNRIAGEVYRDRGDAMSNAAFLGGRENHIMNASENRHRQQVAHLTNFDLDRLMDDSWDNLGEDGQKALIDDCYQMLRRRNPGADELVVYNQAKDFARQQSDLRMYHLAVEKNLPQGNLEYLLRKVGDMNLLMNVSKGLSVSQAKSTGDMAAYEAANEQYRQDGHKVLDVTGMVAGFAFDPTTWLSAAVGGAAAKCAMWASGRYLAGRGASAAVTKAATRQFATSMAGRIVGGIAGGAANFGTFEGVKEIENQFAHGGHIVGQDETGQYINEGYSASAVGGQALHGLMMGGAVGWLGPVSGNVSDKLVRATSSTLGKAATRAGVYTGATIAEGTIFSVPEWIEGKRDAMDVWNDNMAMMIGFKAKHIVKSAGGVLGDLKASFDSPTNGQKNRLDFESHLRQRMDAPSDGGLALTKDEAAELKRYGYDLRELVESAERTGNAAKGSLIAKNAPEIVSRLTDMVKDTRVSEAARAKMYYYATGRKLPMSTVMRGEMFKNGDGGYTVESQGANGVITSRSFKSRKAADLEMERIKRQAELNTIEIGERYQQIVDFDERMQEASRRVAAKYGWDPVDVYRTYEAIRDNTLRHGQTKELSDAQKNIYGKILSELEGIEENKDLATQKRNAINEKYGVDIDGAIRKEGNRRTLQEQTAIDEYIEALIPNKAKENYPQQKLLEHDGVEREIEDVEATDITDAPTEQSIPVDGEAIDPRFDNSTDPTPDYDPHQPGGEQKPIGRAVMKYQDRPVEVLSGRVVMHEDGTMVDNARSDRSIVIRDVATGQIEMVSPEAILSYEDYVDPTSEGAETIHAESDAAEMQPQSQYTRGQIKIRNSDGTETRGVLTGYVDKNGNHEYYVEGDLQRLHYASEHELNNILSEYIPDEPQVLNDESGQSEDYRRGFESNITEASSFDNEYLDKQITDLEHPEVNLTDYGRGMLDAYKQEQQRRIQSSQSAQTESSIEPVSAEGSINVENIPIPTGVNPVGSLAVPQRDGSTRTFTVGKNEDGDNVVIDERGFIWAHDGTGNGLQPYSPGANVPTWSDEHLSKIGTFQPSAVPNQSESVPNSTETSQNSTENAVSQGEPVPNSANSVGNGQEISEQGADLTPLQRIPRNEKNEPMFEQAESPEAGWDALVEFSEGDISTAKEIADTMAEEKRKAYEKLQKQKPKGKTPSEILASKKAISSNLAQAEQEYNIWQQMANVEQRRQDALRAEREAEERRLAAERAEAEKAEIAAREEAENAWNEQKRRLDKRLRKTAEIVKDCEEALSILEMTQPINMLEAASVVLSTYKVIPRNEGVKKGFRDMTGYGNGEQKKLFGLFAKGSNGGRTLESLAEDPMLGVCEEYGIPYENSEALNTLLDLLQMCGTIGDIRNFIANNRIEQALECYESWKRTYERSEEDYLDELIYLEYGITRAEYEDFRQQYLDYMESEIEKLDADFDSYEFYGNIADEMAERAESAQRRMKDYGNRQGEIESNRSGGDEADSGNGSEGTGEISGRGGEVLPDASSVFSERERADGAGSGIHEKDGLGVTVQKEFSSDGSPGGSVLGEAVEPTKFDRTVPATPEAQRSAISRIIDFAKTIKNRVERAVIGGITTRQAKDFAELGIDVDETWVHSFESSAVGHNQKHHGNAQTEDNRGQIAITSEDYARIPEILESYDNVRESPNISHRSGNDVIIYEKEFEDGYVYYLEEKRDKRKSLSFQTMYKKKKGTDSSDGLMHDASTSTPLATPDNLSSNSGDKVSTLSSDKQVIDGESSVQSSDNKDEQSVQAAVEEASAEVNPEPTPAQAEAGNYKKGHVTIGEFDITIENPAGSVRKGIDADGEEWRTTMANTYGYIKGTEGVDGDHIDVFLHEDMDTWNGRKVFVVDQTNTDGSFDEHKVMLGFNDKDEAMNAYLGNYDKTWADTHPGLRISETNIEDFNKWIQSSHRKTKPFAEYSTISKVVDEAPVKGEPMQPVATIEGDGYKVEAKPYTNKQGKTLDTYLVTFDRDFSKEELSALRAKVKALKGWYDRESRGWMLRSREDADSFAKEVAVKNEDEIADSAPLSMADMKKPRSSATPKSSAKRTERPVKKVDVEGVFDALKTKGETKLSDNSKPIEGTPKSKKRRWISDEDADEFDSIRKDLRNHFGKDNEMVQEEGASYGQKKPKQMDAEVLRMGTRMTYLMMKGGLRSFSDYCEAMKDELPDIFDEMRPHLKSLYAAAQNMEEVMQLGWDEEMDDRKTVKAFDVYNFDNPGAKDIIATAQHIVDENASQQQTDKIIQTLKDQRNEQRKKEADETSANTETIIDKAETTASQVESELETAKTEQDAEDLNQAIDAEIEKINEQLALLGYYEADPVDKDFNEAYGYMRNAERKAVQDAHRLATQLASDLGIKIDPKDKVRKAKYGFGSKIARSNVAPAGGEVYITLPLTEGRELSIWLSLDKNAPWREGGREDRYDEDLLLTGIMYRIENTGKGGMDRYESSNHNTRPTVPYDELLSDIRRLVRTYLPDEQVKPATPLTPQPGEDVVDMAKRVASDKEHKSPSVEPQLPIGDLFGGLFDEVPSETPMPVAPVEDKGIDPTLRPVVDLLKGEGLKPSKVKNDNLRKLFVQHGEMKERHPDALLIFRVGNNYEVLSTDAEEVAKILSLPLSKFTNDGKEIPFTEFPHHALDMYLPQMVRAGKRVAICEQLEDPKESKQTVKRGGDTATTSNPKENEKTDVQPRTEETGRGRQQPRPDEPLGESAKHEDERTDGGRMAQRGGEHSLSDTERGAGLSGQHKGEGSLSEPKNRHNNHAERGVDYAPKGEKARIDANLAAIELAKKLLATGASATEKEMAILRRYSGWGGLGSAFNEGNSWAPNPINKRLREVLTPEEYEAAVMSRNSAYYTPAPVIDAMWDIAKALGFKGGNIMEGSAGIGNIIGLMPIDISERSNIHAVEIDNTTGGILSLLYPDAKVEIQGFEKTRIANGSVDLAITNVPFVTGLHVMDESGDSDLSKKFRDIHDFCIAKNVRKLREGGIGIFITSSGTLDKSQKLRNWLVGDKDGNTDVVGVFRMNNQTFGGTAATSDIIVVRKRVNGRRSANAIDVSTVPAVRTATYTDVRGRTKDIPLHLNRYFIEHPEHMGGEMYFGFEQGDTYRPTSIGLFPTRTADQASRMEAWVKELAAKDWRREAVSQSIEQTSQINEALGEGVKEGSMVIDSEGNLCIARMGRAVPLSLNKNKIKGRTKEQCFADYTEIKTALSDVLKYQTEHDDDAGLQPLIERLNKAYDTFVERYGHLNKNNNLAWLRNDVDFSSVVALETYSEKGNKDGSKVKTYGKTDIFSRRVVEKEREPAPKNVKDGIIASLYKYGRIDSEYLSKQLGKSEAEVKREIVESGLGFEDPTTGQMEVSYEYLSGNVREKLRQAREANVASEGAYDANIKALEAVVPMNIPAHLIEFALGSSWIEPKLYERYVKERTELDVRLTNAGGTWHMREPWHTDTPKNTEMGVRSEMFGTLIPGHKLIEAAITNKTISVSRTVKDSEGGTHTETDQAATTACATKVDEIRQDFKDWAREQMQNDPDLSMRMEEIYNEKFNNSVPKTIPDEFVPEHFGGAATTVGGKPFRLRPHQAKAVIRATTQPVLLAHEVGTGKTYTLITTAMEMRRLGTARKPMIVVQNATVGQFVASAKALYPNAKVLTLEDADRNADGRKAFYAKIKFNDWDMIVVPQSVFERIPDSIERQSQFIQDKIEEKLLVLEQMKEADPAGRSMIVRAAEREISRLEDEMTQLANGGVPTDKKKEKDAKKAAITRQNAEVKARELLDRATDDVEDFDSMGIDAILVDEAHEYKHLGFATAMQRGVKGVDPSPSKKSQGVFLKAQAVLEKTGGKNVVFATGTPISNTAAEIWTFMRYLIPADVMKEYDIYYFDDFVRNFGNLQQMLEFKTNGKYDEVNRFAGYVNLPELVRIWSTVADTVLTREAGGVSDKIPQMEGDKAQDIFLPQTRALRSIMKYVKEQLDDYDKMSGKEKKENSHIPLVMYGIAKAAAVDARLVQSDADDDPKSKTNEAVRQTLRSLEETKEYKGTVAIFADNYQNKASGFNLYEDIRKKLIAAGVPEEQVVVMKSGMTVKKKLEIFDKVNAGEVRVVLGSTFTLGTGVNIQERLHTLIHLDAPNRPMDYTQRNGRILRQGNLHNTWGLPVRILRFGVEDSLDVTAYQRLKTKGAIADSIMNGKQLMENSMENRSLEEDQDLFGDITAQLSGSEYAMLKNQIEKEVRKLRAAEKNWKADQTYIHNRKRQIAGQNREAEKRITENRGYLKKIEAATIGDITVGKLSFPSVEAMEDFFTEQNKKKAAMQEEVRKSGYSTRPATSDITISVGGFDFNIHTEISRETKQGQQGDLFYSAPAKMTYSCAELGIDKMPVRGNLIKNVVTDIMENVVSGNDFRERVEHAERYIERNNAELESMAKREGVPFKDADALAKAEEKLAEYEELMKAEMAAKEAKYAELDKDVEAASNVELTDEDNEPTANEPIEQYSDKNANFASPSDDFKGVQRFSIASPSEDFNGVQRITFASRYETKDGKTVNYTSENSKGDGGLFDFDFSGENAGGTERDNRTRFTDIQRERSRSLVSPNGGRLNEKTGEFCKVERVFNESGSFKFTSGEKIESADDVAFIFSALEDAAVEHTFAVYVKDGVPTVVELGMGTFNASIAATGPAYLAYTRIKPDEVYFVHNHPGGNLKCSPQDVNVLKQMQGMMDVPVHGVIVNLKTGKYGTFDTENNTGVGEKRIPEQEYPLTIHKLDKQIFSPDYDPMTVAKVRGSEDVASFVNSHRMGDRAKMSFLVISQSGGVIGNIHTPYKQVSPLNVEKMAQYISERVLQFGGMSAIVYGDFSGENNRKGIQILRERMKQLGGVNLLDVMRIEGNFTFSANDEGILYEPGTEYGASEDGDIRFREVEDEAVLQEFAEGKTVKVYRTMQVIEGKLYSPMATKVGGKSTPEIKLGVPEQAEEHPEIIKKTKMGKDGVEYGIVSIDKGLGKGSLEVAYNSYIHASRTPINDQFTSGHIRPNLVTVESLVPESELTSGYRAPMAKNSVGEMPWHSGSVSGQLAALGKPRRVILSRYDMPVRIVPNKEVAQMIAEQLDGTGIEIPYNVVTPQVRMELERLGVAISERASGSVGKEPDFGKAEYITDQEIERINARQMEMAQTSEEAKSGYAERMAKKFNTAIEVISDPNELTSDNSERQARMRKSKGFYDPSTGKIVVVLPNNANVEDVAETVFHEVVAHKGLREMVGDENYDTFCDEVYGHLKDDLKEEVDEEATRRFVNDPGKGYEHARRVAVDEMFGRLSEKGFEDFTKAERSIWAKLKAKVLEAINKFLGSLKLPKWVKLGDNELRYILWRSHERLRGKSDYVDMARDVAKREELGLTNDVRFRDGETGDIWKDQSVGLEERITNAAIRLSNNQSGDLTLRNDAMRAIGGNLTSLRKAMAAQKAFDQSTVKRVADLARILMQNGYLSGMTSGEVQRLISAVKNSVGHNEVKESVQKIMDIMVNNQLRNAEGTLRQLLSIRGSKADARGVEVQGMLDVEGQRTMEVVKKAMSLTEDDINDRIAEVINRMSDPDQTIAEQAALEYAGLHMALDYVQNIANSKAEEKALRDELKTAKEDKAAGRMSADAYAQFVETTEDAIRKNKIERAEAYFNLVGRLSDSLRGSIENAKAFREAEKARVNEIHHNANSDMEGRPNNEHHIDDWKDKIMNNDFVQFLFAPLGTFDQMLRVFGNKSANGEGYLWNRFMRGWVDCRNKELLGVKDKFARLDEKAVELFGKGKTWGDIIRMEVKLPKATVSFWDGGEMRDHELTQGNLLYIYMVDKMTDGRMKLRRMGITEDDVRDIENILDPRFKALGDWLQDEFLVETRNEYNETHKRMFGASMAAIENYFPLKILANARVDKEEDVNQPNRPDGITTKTGSIIKRRVNNLALDITGADAMSVILDHITQMEHWNAYAEWNRDLNTLRTYKRFRNQVINMTTVYGGGRKLWDNFNDLCLMAAGEYRPPVSKFNKSAVNLAKGVTAAKVSFRMFTALKQMLSAPAYIPEVSAYAIAKSIINPYGDFKWCMENLPIFRERWHSRISGDPRLLKSDMDWKMWRSRVMEISSRIGMTPNAFVDAVTVSIGSKAMYETRLKQYLKEGYPAELAEKRAMQDAAILFNQTQQSSESPFLSTMQVDKDWLSTVFTVFRNSAMSYTRQEYDAMRNLKRNLTPGQRAKSVEFMTKQILRDWDIDPDTATEAERNQAKGRAYKRFLRQIKKDVLRLATFGFILEWLWNLGPYLPYLIFGNNDDEKDKMWDDAITHAYFGSVEGLTGGDVMSSFGNMATSGEWNWNQLSKDMPLASDINTIASKFIGGKNAEAVNDIINLVVQMGVGMNPQSITDAAVAITDACGDDPALSHEAAIFAMRVLQVPQSQIDKMYFDEVDLTREEASKLTPAELAGRYAEYKVKRGTPLAPWSWGDEERLGKYNKLATERMQERLYSQGDAKVIEAYADYESRYKAVSEKAKEAKELMKTDYAAAAQAHAALQRDPDFVLYQRFGSLDKELGRLSKMWLTSKTPEEASLIATTICSYRAGMVEVLEAETEESQQSAMTKLTTLMNDFYAKYQGMQPKSVNR